MDFTAQRPVHVGTAGRVAAAAVAIEGLVLLAVAVRLVVELTSAAPADRGGAITEVVLSVGFGAGLLGCASFLLRGRRWPRGLLVTWQLLQVAVAIPALRDQWYLGAGLLLLSAVGLVALVRLPSAGPAGPA